MIQKMVIDCDTEDDQSPGNHTGNDLNLAYYTGELPTVTALLSLDPGSNRSLHALMAGTDLHDLRENDFPARRGTATYTGRAKYTGSRAAYTGRY